MPDTGAPDSAVQDAITDPFDIMPDEDGVDGVGKDGVGAGA